MRNTDSQLPCPSTDTDTLSSEDNSENDGASKIIADSKGCDECNGATKIQCKCVASSVPPLRHSNTQPTIPITQLAPPGGDGEAASAKRRPSRSISELDEQLLAKLHMLNQDLENDSRMIMNVSPETHHRQTDGKAFEDTDSMKSTGSHSSSNTDHINNNISANEKSPEDQLAHLWSHMIHDWQNVIKKKQQTVKTSACEKVIRRDIARTYPEHKFFMEKDGQGQESLFNVMKAYSLHDREVGYCQGSGFIVGLLLMLMPEEETFSVFIQIMMEYKMRNLFKPGMAELGSCMYQLEYLIQSHSPPLYQHFQAQSFHTSMYASSWFLTLFTTQLPLHVCFRIMDIFLFEGMEIVFRIGVALLLLGEADLLCMDMEGMLMYFQDKVSEMYDSEEAVNSLMDTATHKVKYNAKRMRSLEKEFVDLKKRENEDQVELRRLRSENRLLRQRIENLEKENVSLADRLIQGQVTRAQEAEVMFSVKRELSQLREQNKELHRSLSASEEQISELKVKKQCLSGHQPWSRRFSVPAGTVYPDELSRPSAFNGRVRHLHSVLGDLQTSRSSVTSTISEDIESDEKFQSLQEELIAVKLREAESNLALRELANHVTELDREWQKQLERTPNDKLSKPQTQALHEELMSCRLRAAESNTDNKQLRLRVMELETSGQIIGNQVHRLMDENERLRGDISSGKEREQTLGNEVEELRNKIADIESKSKEEVIKYKINDAEQSQLVAELRQKIAELEISREECQVTNEINNTSHQPLYQDIKGFTGGLNSRMSFSTLDVFKGTTETDSLSDTDESAKVTDLDIAISSAASNSKVAASKPKTKQLVSMEMDADDDAFL
ncbi:EVI5L [Bugula neritina]|uniref:EVI5L n=1 Tax=Bugula neritina TaxID=10212 RepID=A0A7J7J5A0_BUGNE|nr:EVI5L [Bugula neritina]